MGIKGYKELDVWNKGIEIVDKVYELTEKFPSQERYGLVSQMQRASVSIPSNIAEGFVRNHGKEYIQFLYVAMSSCAELDTQSIISFRRKYIMQNDLSDLQKIIEHESRMLMNLIKSVRQSKY
jgi:four helix bundle protein